MPLLVRQFKGDGTSCAGETFEHKVRDIDSGDVLEGVEITCLVLSKSEVRAFYANRTTRRSNPRTRAMEDIVDMEGAADDILKTIIQGWTGIVGKDGAELVCNDATKLGLPDPLRAQVVEAALGSEVTGRGPSTFPQPA